MTLPGVDMTVASGVAAAIGDIKRFAGPQKLVAYLGLNPSVRQSGEGPAYHGRITKQGRGQARCLHRLPLLPARESDTENSSQKRSSLLGADHGWKRAATCSGSSSLTASGVFGSTAPYTA